MSASCPVGCVASREASARADALLDEVTRLRERLARVEALADEWAAPGRAGYVSDEAHYGSEFAARLRGALDGEGGA